MTYDDLLKKISKILTPKTNKLYQNVMECGFVPLEENEYLIGTGKKWGRYFGRNLDDFWSYDARPQERVLILMKFEYKEEEYDSQEQDNMSLEYIWYLGEHPFLKNGLWTGDMRYDYAYIIDIKKEEYWLASKWERSALPSEMKVEYKDTYLEHIYNELLKECFGIEIQIEQDYLKLVRRAAKLAYTIACFNEEEIYSDVEAQKEFMKIEDEFISELSHFHGSVAEIKGRSAAYHMLSESATANYELAILISTIGALEKRAIGCPYDFYWERHKEQWEKSKAKKGCEKHI